MDVGTNDKQDILDRGSKEGRKRPGSDKINEKALQWLRFSLIIGTVQWAFEQF